MKEDKIIKALEKIDFISRYRRITEKFGDLNSRWSPKKNQVESLLNDSEFTFAYSSKEKMFSTVFDVDKNELKFLISYKYGVLEGWFQLFEGQKIIMNNRFDFLGEKIEEGYRDSLVSSLPICTSEDDLREIIVNLLSIYRDLKNTISNTIDCLIPIA